jgi:hypothetical protein
MTPRLRAKDAIVEAGEAQRKAEVAVADLTTRVSEFQAWTTSTEAALWAREAAVLEAERVSQEREQENRNRAAEIEQREVEHANLMKRLRAHLEEFV